MTLNIEAAILLVGELDDLLSAGAELAAAVHVYIDEPLVPEDRQRQREACAQTYERVMPDFAAAVQRTARVLEHIANGVPPAGVSIAERVAALSALDDAAKVSRALRAATDGLNTILDHVPSNDGVRGLAASTLVRVHDALPEPGA